MTLFSGPAFILLSKLDTAAKFCSLLTLGASMPVRRYHAAFPLQEYFVLRELFSRVSFPGEKIAEISFLNL